MTGAQAYVPHTHDLEQLAEAARRCEGCGLYRDAEQTVFGVGSADATIMLVGEQPGGQEDRKGPPFVGPAGRLLDMALVAAEVDRERRYVTNAVKHFKFTRASGTRRIHETPSRTKVVARGTGIVGQRFSAHRTSRRGIAPACRTGSRGRPQRGDHRASVGGAARSGRGADQELRRACR